MSLIERAVQRLDTAQRLARSPAPPHAMLAMHRRAEDVRAYLQTSPLNLVPPPARRPPGVVASATSGPSWGTCAVIALACLGLGAGIMRAYVGGFADGAPLRGPDIAVSSSMPAPVSAMAPARAPTDAATPPAAAPSIDVRGQVAATVRQWAAAWSARDAGRYLGFYAKEFVPPARLSRQAWEDQRRARVLGAQGITVLIEDLSVELLAAERAIVRFAQTYEAGRYRELRTPKVLILAREGDSWRIASETSPR